MNFSKSISKDEIAALPLYGYDGRVVILDDKKHIAAAFEEIFEETIVGIDSETKPCFKKGQYNHTALIQLATAKAVYLVKPQKTGLPNEFVHLLENKKIIKVGIAIAQDLTDLRKFKPFKEKSMIDLNNVCSQLGFQNIGAKNLSGIFLGYRISKSQQTSNWEQDPLTHQQVLYAATDAWICREILSKMLQAGLYKL